MMEEDGKPRIGRCPRLLGVRLGRDIDVERMPRGWLDENGYLLPSEERVNSGQQVDVAIRNNKGMSTSLSIEGLPNFRKPPAFGGIGKDPLWKIDDSKLVGDIEAVQDSPTHVSIMPRTTMLLEKYETALACTQKDWEKVPEPESARDLS
jgi:hypothetical protein